MAYPQGQPLCGIHGWNRTVLIDSRMSLDAGMQPHDDQDDAHPPDHEPMSASTIPYPTTALPEPVRLTRVDPSRNMARFYTLSVEVSLFDGFTCTRGFGRIGSRGGRLMIGLFDTQGEAEAELARWLRAKQERGYQRDLTG
jgi:predicted DNA-binding WGR domain protein